MGIVSEWFRKNTYSNSSRRSLWPEAEREITGLPLLGGEVTAFRSLVYKLQWVGRETRAEAAGTASILATK
eukprot:3001656-Pyramimonas_sp.AAC.1